MSSYWINSTKDLGDFGKINNNYQADVCIIGAGITGLSTAYYLSKLGLKVVILDKNAIGEKVSGNTTAKITFQHNLIYDYLINSYSYDLALGYLKSNKKAISNIKQIIDTENIDCDFEYQDNFVYTTKQEDLVKIHNEVKALNSLGESAEFVTKCGLPFKIAGAVKTVNQAQFHPRKYMLGLAKAIQSYAGLIFTNTIVTDIQKSVDGYITYANDYTISSKHIVLASHYPFINFPGLYFSKMYQSTSYALAIDTHGKLFDGMYINPTEPIYSFRTAIYGDKKLLIMAGGDHKTGYAPDSTNGYNYLEEKAKELYPNCNILYKWNTRDCMSLDKIPYIGEFSNLMPNMYVATGFNKWGMTSSNVAANVIKDMILGRENKYAFVFDSTRLKPLKNRVELGHMASQVFKSFVSNRIKVPHHTLLAIEKDNGGIIKVNGTNVGIYKDSDGNVFAVNPTCTHLGCLLTWNNLDKTWDCPCHGSRFDFTGKNIYDPAFKNLDTFNVDNDV
ncbi:MAG: FAD-dependent oxidoreductase [Clostridia bacterium]|nr:FAD-dependent oxidoreductase [Clostridia bacterium]